MNFSDCLSFTFDEFAIGRVIFRTLDQRIKEYPTSLLQFALFVISDFPKKSALQSLIGFICNQISFSMLFSVDSLLI